MSYPSWVLLHKKKGTYVNKVGNNYYLYAAHSEHVPGTANQSRRICDGYLGKITEMDGFIPKKIKPSPATSEYGLSCAIVSLCQKPFLRIVLDYPSTYKEIILRSILLFIYKQNVERLQHLSYISIFISKNFLLDEKTDFLIRRTSRMIQSTLIKAFPDSDDLMCFMMEMQSIQRVKMNKDQLISQLSTNSNHWITSLHLDFEENNLWKKLQN